MLMFLIKKNYVNLLGNVLESKSKCLNKQKKSKFLDNEHNRKVGDCGDGG